MPAPLAVTLYGRPGCHLCEDAANSLRKIARRVPLTVEEVDIESSDELLSRYLVEIPVIAVDGVEIAKAPIRARALEMELARMAQAKR